MKKHKLLTPAGILGIIGSSISLLAGLSLIISVAASGVSLNVIATQFIFILVIGILLLFVGIFGVIICSLALGANKKRSYSVNGKKLCIASLAANIALLALLFFELVMELSINRTFLLDLSSAFILCLLSVIFYSIGISKSIPGTNEEINRALMLNVNSNVGYIVNTQPTNPVDITLNKANESIANTTEDLIATLEKLYNLYQNGILTQEEYEKKKKVILEKL